MRVGGLRGSERLDPYAGSDVPGLRTIEPDPKLYRNAPFRERREPRSLTLSARWERDVATGGLSHHLKLGGEHTGGSWLAERRRNGGLTWRPGDQRVCVMDISRAKVELGWEPKVGVSEGVERLARWVAENRRLFSG